MAEETGIEWTDATFNPWIGCTKVSPGCDHCYAEARMDTRLHIVQWGPGQPRKRTSTKNWKEPGRWNDEADVFEAEYGRRRRVFCASLADVFDTEVDVAWRTDLFELIRTTPRLDWLLLTKRIGNVPKMVAGALAWAQARGDRRELVEWLARWVEGTPPDNIWLGASIVNQEEADRDIHKLLAAAARVRFLSMEPLLEPVELLMRGLLHGIDWVIVGGESGPGARPMSLRWVRHLRDQCWTAGVPFLFKQWGEWIPSETDDQPVYKGEHRFLDGAHMFRIGKHRAGRTLDGQLHDGYPRC